MLGLLQKAGMDVVAGKMQQERRTAFTLYVFEEEVQQDDIKNYLKRFRKQDDLIELKEIFRLNNFLLIYL